ncbi:transglutaminase family protein [Kangiella sp. TOML190]|uniref:transglutaminase-like domain-containing protein n=1 Tax=Kangiella sp. TOML190 TaxID=2931351 RepID=UPI002040D17F|nr:transglutaminase-like domain-containing protein [Kangiella sp. TOML190]
MQKPKLIWVLTALLIVTGLAALFYWQHHSKQETSSLWQPESVQPFKQWYQINWQKQAVGWASIELLKGDKHISIIEEDLIEGRVQGQRLKFQFKRRLNFAKKAPYNLVSGQIYSNEPQLLIEKNFQNHKQLLVDIKRNTRSEQKKLKAVKYSLNDYFRVRQFIEQAPLENDLLIVKELNSDDFGLHYSRYQVQQVKSNNQPYFQLIHQLQNSNQANDAYQSEADFQFFSADGVMIKRQRANGISFVASEGKVSLNPEMQRDLYLGSGILIDKPLGDPRKVKSLELSLNGADIKILQGHPALTIDNSRLVNDAGQQYPAPQAVLQATSHRKIASIARAKVETLKGGQAKTKRLLEFVHNYLTYKVLPASFNLDDILVNRIGDCTEHALLLTEMLNSVGIPAREVSGLIYLGDDKQRFGGHVWVEAYFDGKWHGIDPTWNLFELTATHIPLAIGSEKSPKILSKASQLSFRLEKVDYIP